MQQWHITLTSSHRQTLFQTEQELRAAVRTIDRVAGDCVIMFCIVDDHTHVWVFAPADRIDALARSLRHALEPSAAVPLDVVYYKPVATRNHQRRMVPYLLDQLEHHGVKASPATWPGGCYQDLIGARKLDRFRFRLRQVLPRLRRDELDSAVGLAPGELRDATADEIRRAGAIGIAEAALASVAAGPVVTGHPRHVTRARRAAAHLAEAVGIRTVDLADAFDLPPRTVRRLVSEAADPDLVRAIRLQVALARLPLTRAADPSAAQAR